jgi:hypothetical protein
MAWPNIRRRGQPASSPAGWEIPLGGAFGRRSLAIDPMGEELGLAVPIRTAIGRALAQPAERVGRDLGEAPADRGTGIVLAVLHDGAAAGATDLPSVQLLQRIAPENVPSVDAGIVDPQCRAVKKSRQYPHVLNGAAFERPSGVDFTATGVQRSAAGRSA